MYINNHTLWSIPRTLKTEAKVTGEGRDRDVIKAGAGSKDSTFLGLKWQPNFSSVLTNG
jgi:hypothetical protein